MAKKETDKFYEAEQIVEAKTRNFLERNSKIIAGSTIAILVLVILGYGYKQLISTPKENKAQTQMIRAQQYFEKDSFNLALNGDGVALGFKDIINKYSSTKAGNGAKLYAGISALHVGSYEEAIKYLESFSTDDALLNSRKYGCIGDAKAELKDMKSAEENYQKAVDADKENEISAPFYLYKLAKVQIINKKTVEAAKTFQTLIDNFPTSIEGSTAERELAQLNASN
ncbi:MAG: tetratricopeptide repeat protein [Chitinophagales bacterium]|nr:tetratricopeptide repeat protein [Chitinophagales bacterium]MCZ2393448.1 tetratricopeptide repeat protein [Chitinophagales bacterium]